MTALASRVGAEGVLRFNPSPFERDGVPGLGWLAGGEAATDEPVDLCVENGRVEAGGLRLRLIDQFDAGDLYNFCPDPHEKPAGPVRIRADLGTFEARFDGMRVFEAVPIAVMGRPKDSGIGWPASFSSWGFGSKRSRWLGPPSMKSQMIAFACGG